MDKRLYTTLTDKELIERCEFLIKDFCHNGFKSSEWTMRIPAEPNRDPDLVFGELIRRFKKNNQEKTND